MKMNYDAPQVEIINLEAMERIAALDGHPDEGVSAAANGDDGNIFNPSFGVVQRP